MGIEGHVPCSQLPGAGDRLYYSEGRSGISRGSDSILLGHLLFSALQAVSQAFAFHFFPQKSN